MNMKTVLELIENQPEQERQRTEYHRQVLKQMIIKSNGYHPEHERVTN